MEEKEFKDIQKQIIDHIDQALKNLEAAKSECFKSRISQFTKPAENEEEGIQAVIKKLGSIRSTINCVIFPTGSEIP